MSSVRPVSPHLRLSATSREGYPFEPASEAWRLSRDEVLSLRWAESVMSRELRETLTQVLAHYAVNYSASYTRNLGDKFAIFFKSTHASMGKVHRIRSLDLINYRSALGKHDEWLLGILGGPLRKWMDLGLPYIDEGVRDLLDGWSFKAAPKGEAIRTQCPIKGALTDIEYAALQCALLDAFDLDELDLDRFALTMLFMATGRRGCQLGDLKHKDLLLVRSDDGLQEFVLNVPRRKQQNTPWRTKFKPVALTPEIGRVVKALMESNIRRARELAPRLPPKALEEFPLFAWWPRAKEELEEGSPSVLSALKGEALHCRTDKLRYELQRAVASVNAVSERTGQRIHIFPTRLRRTVATRAVREGYGVLVVAELLDHNDTQNAGVYTENVPEHVDAINAAVAMELAPLAQAFCGMLVDREADAVRGGDPTSRIRTTEGAAAGTCGHYGFCGALAPIACYTCRHFQPWLDGPHDEVLDSLLKERSRIAELTRDDAMAAINDRTILAVAEVIHRCQLRRVELDGEAHA
jgi:hypothetical protein